HPQRDPRCALAARHRAYRHAGHPRADLARDPKRAPGLIMAANELASRVRQGTRSAVKSPSSPPPDGAARCALSRKWLNDPTTRLHTRRRTARRDLNAPKPAE